MQFAEPSAVNKQTLPSDHPDMEMETYLMLGIDNQIYVLHEDDFQKQLAWLEYNDDEGQLNFVMEDGDVRYLGIPVEKKFRKYFFQQDCIVVGKIKKGEFVEGYRYPLIRYEI